MGRRSRHKKASRRNAAEAARQLTGLPPTLASVQKLQRDYSEQHSAMADDVLTLHPDFADVDDSQMAFDKAIFEQIENVTLIRHPYPSELDLKKVYEEENGVGSAAGLLLVLNVYCSDPSQLGIRSKVPTAIGAENDLYQQLSKGYCAIVGGHGPNSLFYGILHQRLPIEIVQTGVMPMPTYVS